MSGMYRDIMGPGSELAAQMAVEDFGGKVLGRPIEVVSGDHQAKPDIGAAMAMSSKAKVMWLISAAEDTTNALKQAKEFGVAQSGQRIVMPLTYITNVHALGIENVQGLTLVTPFYWNRTTETRDWSERFFKRHHAMPTMDQAAVYSGTLHYLQAVAAANTLDGLKVADEMRKLPVNDMYVQDGHLRPDGWLMHPFYLASNKLPDEVKQPWDYYNIEKTIPDEQAAQPLSQSQCPLVTLSH